MFPRLANGRLLLPCLVVSVLAFSEKAPLLPAQPVDDPPPNIVLILADDLGYCDTSLYDCATIPTPAIASIAEQGVTLTDAYVTAATGSPSRAALLTGRYQQRFGFEFNTGSARVTNDQKRGLPKNQATIADHLRSAGYRTGLVGKWHQGNTDGYHPLDRGFDEFYGFLPGARSYFQDQPEGKNAASRRVAPQDRRAGRRPEDLFWRNGPNKAIRSQHKKLFWNNDHDWLFDLRTDGAERKNLAAIESERVQELKGRHLQWQTELADPAWPSRPGRSKSIDGVTVEVHV